MKKSSIKNDLKINLLITITSGILTFVVNKYFAKYMGIDYLGLMRLFTQMIVCLNLAELGLGTASTYSLYKPLIEKNYKEINIIISTIGYMYKKISVIIFIMGLLFNFLIVFFVERKLLNINIYFYWNLYVLSTIISYSFAKYSILFIANQEYKFIRIIQGFSKIVIQFLQILVLLKFQSFFIFIFLLILENIIQYICYKIHYNKYYFYIKIVKIIDKKILKDLSKLFWHKIGDLVVFNTDYILISKFISLQMVGIYSSYLIIINIVGVFISIIINVITPRIGEFISQNNKKNIFKLWKELNIIFVFLATISTYLTYKLINSFINLWLGKEYLLVKTTVILIMINLFLKSSSALMGAFKNGSGFFDDIYIPITESILNFGISIILVIKIGINGVIIGTICSNIIIILLARPILVFNRCFNKNWNDYIKILIEYLILSFLVLFISEKIINKLVIEDILTWKEWILTGITISFIVVCIGLIIFSLNKDFRNSFKKYLIIN